jgi:hypothetical protein
VVYFLLSVSLLFEIVKEEDTIGRKELESAKPGQPLPSYLIASSLKANLVEVEDTDVSVLTR